jgi:decaprenyl-phosphate phosphoribosyltransferase
MASWRTAFRRTEAAGLLAHPAPPRMLLPTASTPAPAGSATPRHVTPLIVTPTEAGLPPGRRPRSRAGTLLVAARPRQWIKNLLVFAAPATAGALSRPAEVGRAGGAAVILILASAGVYLINDVVDAPADRAHPDKRSRPVASGELPVPAALAAGSVALVLAFGASAILAGPALLAIVASYATISISYSLWLKQVPVIELGCVFSGFLLRAVAGGAAAGVALSPWFIIVTSAAALLVVAGKRTAEKNALSGAAAAHRPVLAHYPPEFLFAVRLIAASAAVMSYALWAFERATHAGSGHPGVSHVVFLLSILPFVMAILVVELAVDTGEGGAPEDLALGNHTLQILGLLCVTLVAIGVYA